MLTTGVHLKMSKQHLLKILMSKHRSSTLVSNMILAKSENRIEICQRFPFSKKLVSWVISQQWSFVFFRRYESCVSCIGIGPRGLGGVSSPPSRTQRNVSHANFGKDFHNVLGQNQNFRVSALIYMYLFKRNKRFG